MNVYRYIYQIQRTSIVQDDTRSGGNVFRRTMEKRGIGVAIDLFRFREPKASRRWKKTRNYVYTID